MLGYQPEDTMRDYMQRASAFIFAAEEDFGIVVVEAQACGTPVIAYAKGGATETVIDGQTGTFFQKQTPESILEAVHAFEARGAEWDPELIRQNAERFSIARFREQFLELVREHWATFRTLRRSERVEADTV